MDGKGKLMAKGVRDEGGMVSILGIGILCVLMFFGAAIYAVTERHMASGRRFLVRNSLRNAAEDGVRLAFAHMNEDASTAARAEAAVSSAAALASFSDHGVSVTAYARKKGNRVLLLGVSQRDAERARAVAVLSRGDAGYIIEHWEH